MPIVISGVPDRQPKIAPAAFFAALRLRCVHIRFKRRHGSDGLSKGVRTLRIEDLVGPHEGDQVFGLGEVDDVVGVARQHVDRLDAIAGDLELHNLVRADLPLLNEAVASNYNEKLPLAVVPVLPLGDAGPRNVHGELAVIDGLQQLRKTAARVTIHLQVEGYLLLRQIGKIHRVQLFLKAAVGDGRHDQRPGLVVKDVQELHDAAQGSLMGHGRIAVATVFAGPGRQAVVGDAVDGIPRLRVLRPVRMSLHRVVHLFDQILNEQHLQLHPRIVDRDRQVVGDVVAEGAHGGIVVGAHPLAHQIRETIDIHRRSCLPGIAEKQLLAVAFGKAVFRGAEPPRQGSLQAAAEHHGAPVAMFSQRVQQRGREPEVALPELLRILRTVDPGQVEDEIAIGAEPVQLRLRIVDIVLVDGFYIQIGPHPILPVPDALEILHQVSTDEALGAGHKDLHDLITPTVLCSCGFIII